MFDRIIARLFAARSRAEDMSSPAGVTIPLVVRPPDEWTVEDQAGLYHFLHVSTVGSKLRAYLYFALYQGFLDGRLHSEYEQGLTQGGAALLGQILAMGERPPSEAEEEEATSGGE